MNVAIFLNTPAQVHFFKNIIKILEKKGHFIYLLSRNYGETGRLLKELNLKTYNYAPFSSKKHSKFIFLPYDVLNSYFYLSHYDIDVVTGFGVYDTIVSNLLGSKNIVFTDSEPSISVLQFIQYRSTLPFSDLIITPDCFKDDLGKRHKRINSYKELSYLHPNYYHPNKSVLKQLDVGENEDYIVLRFNIFDALHDVSKKGFNNDFKRMLIYKLSRKYKLFISFEGELPDEYKQYALDVPKKAMHDVLSFASLLITDTQTMATESALLGCPVIRSNNFVGEHDMGVFKELENKYGLLYNYRNVDCILSKAFEIMENYSKKDWVMKRDVLLSDKMDINPFFIKQLEFICDDGQ